MNFCPYCGAEIISDSASFCSECGKVFYNHKRKTIKENSDAGKIAKEEPDPDFGYDGYYDDIIPSDNVAERQQLDKTTVKNIILICIGVFFIITLCVIAMYLM